MGLATIDPHSHNVHTKFYKILMFGVYRPNSKQDTAIWSGWPYTSYKKLGDFVKLGMHFMTIVDQ